MKSNPLSFWLSLFPYLATGTYFLLVVITTIFLGRPPEYGDSEPDWAEPIRNAAGIFGLLMPWTMIAGVAALLFCLDSSARPKASLWCKRYWPGALLFWAIFYFDPGGTVDWFLD
jgi:hypothetical protein